MHYVITWFGALLLTAGIEVPLVVVLTRGSAVSRGKVVGLASAAQLLTHPAVWFLFPLIPRLSSTSTFVLSELWAWMIEALLYASTAVAPSALRAIAVSAFANGASLAIGLIVL